MSSESEICVLIPVWKDQEGLIVTLNALAEDDTAFDIVVVDDGSPTPITCEASYGIHEVHLHRLPENRGIEHALNAGLTEILKRGYKYVSRLDCADTPMPGRISKQATYMEAHPEVGILGTWARCVNDDGEYLFTLKFPTEHDLMLRKQHYVPAMLHPTIMIRAAALEKLGLYSDQYKTAEDYELFIRMSRAYKIANLPEVLTEYIVSEGGTTKSKRRKNLISRFRVQRDYFVWTNPHAYLGIIRTVIFLVIPFDWLIYVKKQLWT